MLPDAESSLFISCTALDFQSLGKIYIFIFGSTAHSMLFWVFSREFPVSCTAPPWIFNHWAKPCFLNRHSMLFMVEINGCARLHFTYGMLHISVAS